MESREVQQPGSLCQTQVAQHADKSTKHPLEYQMVDWFAARKHGDRRYVTNGWRRDFAVIEDFRDFTGKPSWQWSENDFDSWCRLERFLKLKPITRRTYQGVILGYLKYLETDLTLRGLVSSPHWARFR